MTRKQGLSYLTNDGQDSHLQCFSHYGSTVAECAPVAWRMAANIEYHNGDAITKESLNHLMSLVVNNHDDVPYILREYRIPRRRRSKP